MTTSSALKHALALTFLSLAIIALTACGTTGAASTSSSATTSTATQLSWSPNATLPSGTSGQAYSTSFTASGGTSPFHWIASGLPSGLSLNSSTGAISGTPTQSGSFTVSVTVSDSSSPAQSVSHSLGLAIAAATPALVWPPGASLPGATVGQAYSTTLSASGGTTPYKWSAASLPAGLSLAQSTGVLSGTPTQSGTSSLSITVSDSSSTVQSVTQSVSLAVGTPPPAGLPAQFANLRTDATDLTCSGLVPCATWPMPSTPAAGGFFSDPVFGTTTYRVAVRNGGVQAYSVYSRVQMWNANNTRLILSDENSFAVLYDATTTPPAPINRILVDVGVVDPGDSDALWANTDSNVIYYVPTTSSGHGLELRSVDISNCTAASCSLTSTLVHKFACTTDATSNPELGAGIVGNKIETGSGAQGGMFDATDRYFTFTCDKVDSAGRHEIDFIRYDRQLDQVTTQTKWYNLAPGSNPANNAAFVKVGNKAVNIIRMAQHPNGQDITVIWQAGNYDETWTRGSGIEDFDPSFNFKGVVSGFATHEDLGYDVNGKPVWVGVGSQCLNCRTNSRGGVDNLNTIEIVDLTALSTTLPASGIPTGKVHALLPCSYGYANGSGLPGSSTCYVGPKLGVKASTPHISMTGSWGSVKGYGLFSTLTNYGANAPYATQDAPAVTTLTSAITAMGAQTFPVGSTATIGVGTGITIGVIGGAAPDFCTVTAVSGNNVTCTVAHTHASGETVQNVTAGDTGFGAFEMLAVKIDSTQPDWSPLPWFGRIGRTMSVRDADYNAEPHAGANRDFTQITWGSNWNTDGGTVYGFWTKLP